MFEPSIVSILLKLKISHLDITRLLLQESLFVSVALNMLKFVKLLVDFVHHQLVFIRNIHQNGQNNKHNALINLLLALRDGQIFIFVIGRLSWPLHIAPFFSIANLDGTFHLLLSFKSDVGAAEVGIILLDYIYLVL